MAVEIRQTNYESQSDFNDSIFQEPKIKWFGNKGIVDLSAHTKAVIELKQYGNHKDRFSAYSIRIVDKRRGQLDEHIFPIKDFFIGTVWISRNSDGQLNWSGLSKPRTPEAMSYFKDSMLSYVFKWADKR